MDNLNNTGAQPVNNENNGNSQPLENVELLQAKLLVMQQERDESILRAKEAEESLLKANRAVEAGRKFEKFEDFQKDVLTKIDILEKGHQEKDKEIEDLKKILSHKSSVTPNISSSPSSEPEKQQTTDEELRINKMFGL